MPTLQQSDREQILSDFDSLGDLLLELFPGIKVTEFVDIDLKKIDQTWQKINEVYADIEQKQIKSADHLGKLENYEIEGKKLSQIAAEKVIGNDFQTRANTEKNSAWRWTCLTFICAITIIIFLLYTFISHILDATNNTNNTIDYSLDIFPK